MWWVLPGEIVTDPSKPDGTPRKLLDISKLASLGWHPKIGLEEGLASTYQLVCKSFAAEEKFVRFEPDDGSIGW